MKFKITDRGIQFFDDSDAVKMVEEIAAKQREALERATKPSTNTTVTMGDGESATPEPAEAA